MGTKKKEMQEELNEETTNDYEFQSIDDAKSYISKLNEDLDSQKQRAEEYFDSLRPESFENFESKTLSPSLTERTTLRRIVHPEEFRAKK